jgi:hypothetical protein
MLRVWFGLIFVHTHFTVTVLTKEEWLQVATAEEVYVFQGVILLLRRLWRKITHHFVFYRMFVPQAVASILYLPH